MLDTSLVDAARQQLRVSDLVVANFDSERVPEIIAWQSAQKYIVDLPANFPIPLQKMYYAVPVDCAFVQPKLVRAYLDPAGGGTDELSLYCGCAIGPYIHVLDGIGLKGGFNDTNEEKICEFIAINKVNDITVESNMGHGLFEINLRAALAKRGLSHIGVTGEYSTGQKERRIIDSLVSAMQRHRVVVHKRVFTSDEECSKQHSIEARTQYSVWYQMANITYDRNSLPHDDRLEAFAGVVRLFKGVLASDENKAAEARALADVREFLADPMGYGISKMRSKAKGIRNVIQNRRSR